jgi:hypothetical protein
VKVRKLPIRAHVEVGDRILHDACLTKEWLTVIRTTDRFAIVIQKDGSTLKFPRIVPDVGLRPCGKKDIWSTVQYSAWRPEAEPGTSIS